MKLIIDIPDDVYTRLFDNGIQDNEIATGDICEMARSLRLGTPIPDKATNGDVIKAMFPICCGNMGNLNNGIVVDFNGDLHTFNKDFWNAPYKKGE